MRTLSIINAAKLSVPASWPCVVQPWDSGTDGKQEKNREHPDVRVQVPSRAALSWSVFSSLSSSYHPYSLTAWVFCLLCASTVCVHAYTPEINGLSFVSLLIRELLKYIPHGIPSMRLQAFRGESCMGSLPASRWNEFICCWGLAYYDLECRRG